jgi:hypothetical protein
VRFDARICGKNSNIGTDPGLYTGQKARSPPHAAFADVLFVETNNVQDSHMANP